LSALGLRPLPVTGILVVYYDEYFERAVESFVKLIRQRAEAAFLVVVDNGGIDRSARLPAGIDLYVSGDNRLREFTGWNAGLKACISLGHKPAGSLFVLANDTFCHHKRFVLISRNLFGRALLRTSTGGAPPALWGERYGLGLPFSICGSTAHHWVSTYLFGVPDSYWDQDALLIPERLVTETPHSFEELFALWEVSGNLRRHVLRWLGLEGDGSARWYGTLNGKAVDSASLLAKAACVLAEKYVAARCEGVGAAVEDVFSSPLWSTLRKLERVRSSHRK
jgi:hypothetical protein